jgi:hypothetical protein
LEDEQIARVNRFHLFRGVREHNETAAKVGFDPTFNPQYGPDPMMIISAAYHDDVAHLQWCPCGETKGKVLDTENRFL